MADHAKFVAVANKLINKHGRQVSIKSLSGSSDATKPWRGDATGTETVLGTPLAVFVPSKGFDFGSDFVTDQLLMSVSEVCLVAGGNGDFENGHLITDESIDYRIEWTSRLRPADKTILYAFGIKR